MLPLFHIHSIYKYLPYDGSEGASPAMIVWTLQEMIPLPSHQCNWQCSLWILKLSTNI